MTFMEFTCWALLGPPHKSRPRGEHYWECPACQSPKFHTRPHKPPHKDRFSCWSCGFWGTEIDLLSCSFPNESQTDHSRRWKMLREEWEARDPSECIQADDTPSSPSLSPGLRGQDRPRHKSDDELHQLYDALTPIQKYNLKTALRIARDREADLTELAEYTDAMDAFNRESDELHRMMCDDPDCEADVCRKARGLPPLTLAQRAEMVRLDQERRAVEEARLAHKQQRNREKVLRHFEERMNRSKR